jgi:hypothetical protein
MPTDDILTFSPEYTGVFLPVEIEKIDPTLVGIYVAYNERTVNDKKDFRPICWGTGNILNGLRQLLSKESCLKFYPQYFGYTTQYGHSQATLE